MQIYYMETVFWLGNIPITVLLAKITFLFWILLCCLHSILLFCIDSISWYYFAVPLFCWCSLVPFFCGIPFVLLVFHCSTSVPVLCQCSGVLSVFWCSEFCSSLFQCSWFYSMPESTSPKEIYGHLKDSPP